MLTVSSVLRNGVTLFNTLVVTPKKLQICHERVDVCRVRNLPGRKERKPTPHVGGIGQNADEEAGRAKR